MEELTHLDESGRPRMVDISSKPDTQREAVARGQVSMKPATLKLLKQGPLSKGVVLTVAQLAGNMAAKLSAFLVCTYHHRHRIPANKRADTVFQCTITR